MTDHRACIIISRALLGGAVLAVIFSIMGGSSIAMKGAPWLHTRTSSIGLTGSCTINLVADFCKTISSYVSNDFPYGSLCTSF